MRFLIAFPLKKFRMRLSKVGLPECPLRIRGFRLTGDMRGTDSLIAKENERLSKGVEQSGESNSVTNQEGIREPDGLSASFPQKGG